MESPSKDGATPKKGHRSKATRDGDQKPSSPRSKLKDKKQPPAPVERRYKDMLHATSHIYQPQTASSLSESSERSCVSDKSIQTVPSRVFPSGGVIPAGITADVPLTEIISRDNPTAAVISSENGVDAMDAQLENSVPIQNNVAEETPQEQSSLNENSLESHEEQSSPECNKHSSAHSDKKQKSTISQPKLCDSCATSMLSYIAMLRDMLDEVTNDITNQDQSVRCTECIKERVIEKNQVRTSTHHEPRNDVSERPRDLPLSKKTPVSEMPRDLPLSEQTPVSERSRDLPLSKQTAHQFPASDRASLAEGTPADGIRQSYQQPAQIDARPVSETSSGNKQDMFTSQNIPKNLLDFAQPENRSSEQIAGRTDTGGTKTDIPVVQGDRTKWTDVVSDGHPEQRDVSGISQADRTNQVSRQHRDESRVMDHSESPSYVSDQSRTFSDDPSKGTEIRPDSYPAASSDQHTRQEKPVGGQETPSAPVHRDLRSPTSPFQDREGSDGILSALSNEDREVYDSARGRAGWERLMDSQDYRDTSFGPSSTTEAFVTMATTNAEAISCLVLGSSLQLCRTTRTLCVLLTDGVSPSLRAPLASVFQVVQSIRSLDTLGTTKVALLDQPDLGIFFRKLHAWRLVQFSKCVFLNPDTMMIQNSDELFCHEELSAVPDIGWPDCFNSGVFVFQPSVETFWKLVEFAESEGSYDGGDQGLLNAFFKTWSKDIHKKLSFIYNLMANVSYTYTPAFKQFGRNVKIVQFQGAFKPWHVKFYTETGQISPSTAVHPTYVQFVHVWLNIFRVRVLPLFSQDIQSYASSRNVISASELLKFYPSPIETEVDFLLTPPSVRIRADPLGTPKLPSIVRRHSIGTPKELKIDQPFEVSKEDKIQSPEQPSNDSFASQGSKLEDDVTTKQPLVEEVTQVSEQLSSATQEIETSKTDVPAGGSKTDVPADGSEDDESRRSSIPGSEIGDYHGMTAWEQGRMDYMGSACSENIIKRLHFLMDKSNESEHLNN